MNEANTATESKTNGLTVMGIIGVFFLIMGPIMIVAAVTTGQPPEPEPGRMPPPHRINAIPASWLPEIQAAANHYDRDTVHRVEVTHHHQEEENLLAQLQENIGPALGWHFRTKDRGTVITLPAEDLPLLDRLAEDPAAFVAENAHIQPRTVQPERYLNAHMDWSYVPGKHTPARAVAAFLGFLCCIAGAVMIAAAMPRGRNQEHPGQAGT